MLIPDLFLLAAVLALAAWRLIAPDWRPKRRIVAAGLGLLLAAAQWAVYGFTWQSLPAWLLLALSALPPVRTGAVLRWFGRLGLVGIAAACIGVWILPAVPTLPKPDGRYAVATEVYRWTDPSRHEPHTADTGLATRLANRGFVVFLLDHPYESGVTQLPNGRVVGTEEIIPPDHTQYMPNQQAVRTADIRFVIDQLGRPEALSPRLRGRRIETSKVAVIGHSFGGAAAAMVMSQDPRVVAAANIDGTPYGDLPDRRLTRPFLLLQSDFAETHHSDLFINGNGRLLSQSTAPGFHYEIKRTNHYSFTDAPFFFAPPGRWLLAQVMGGGRGPAVTQQATADIVAAFLSGPLTGVPADLAATAARYPDVLARPAKPGAAA